jgi:DNA-directed RNA polymerase specialized sigma24 family protein
MQQTHSVSALDDPHWQDRFLRLLPRIRRLAYSAFRNCNAQLREELTAEVIADCYCAYHRLVELGREHRAHLTVLVSYAVKRVGSGLQVGSSRNLYDVSSRYSQLHSGIRIESLQCRSEEGQWNELVVEDRRASPAQVAALRVDVAEWLGTLSLRDRAIALLLALGERTSDVARRLGLTPGRVSQLRRTLAKSWAEFHGFDPTEREFTWLAQCVWG